MVLVSAMLLGMRISSRLKVRSDFLSETVLFISRVGMEIEYVNLPVFGIMKKIEQSECCKNLDFIPGCIRELKKGEDFYFSWHKAVKESALPMKKEEKEKLLSLGSLIGTSDAEGQIALLALYKDYFSHFQKRAGEEYEKYGKMCITLSGIVGAGIFIMLM